MQIQPPLRGSFWALVLYDVAEQIRVDNLRSLAGAEPAPRREPRFKHPAPDYVRFERAPVVEQLGLVSMSAGEEFQARIKYFEYGVVSVELRLDFETSWDDLVRLSSRWIAEPEIERRTSEMVRGHVERIKDSLVDPYDIWLNEDYYIIHVRETPDNHGQPLPATALLAEHGRHVAQIVRGEALPLSQSEQNDALQAALSYHPCDLLVPGWVAAFVYDTEEGAAPTIQLLEYANTQLLEFRHYDEVLTRVLNNVYRMLERGGGFLRRWKMAGEAERLNAMRLDVRELAERTDNAIKFLSDMFYARAYRVAASRVGVPDYRNLVDQKLRIAGELYEFMVNEFHQARAFVLEAMVVAILVIELVHLFAGR
ncbi:MAG: hypothetical protein JWO19_3281 [Bryobacterales bacterium]|nr:hypothetical protein [Bryobacterales bacterium]